MQGRVVIEVLSPDSTSVEFVPAAGPLHPPVPAGTILGKLVIKPDGWVGKVIIEPDADSALISVDEAFNVFAKAELTEIRKYTVNLTSDP